MPIKYFLFSSAFVSCSLGVTLNLFMSHYSWDMQLYIQNELNSYADVDILVFRDERSVENHQPHHLGVLPSSYVRLLV